MHRCSKSQFYCPACCDFCRFYDHWTREWCGIQISMGEGWCRKHREKRDPGDACQNFWCMNVPHRVQGKAKAQ